MKEKGNSSQTAVNQVMQNVASSKTAKQAKALSPPETGVNFTIQKKRNNSVKGDTSINSSHPEKQTHSSVKSNAQLKSFSPPDSGIKFTIQKKENKTGMPDHLKSGLENISGVDLSDVKVHYNSSQPAQLNAHAFAQGNQIHIAPGQEKHLPHEGWHIVQQKQGRVKPTKQLKSSVPVNDDPTLEKEADTMGAKASLKQLVLNVSAIKKSKGVSIDVIQPKLLITSSPLSPFTELKYKHFQSLNKRYKEYDKQVFVEAWQILKSMALLQDDFKFENWEAAITKAIEIHKFRPDGLKYWVSYHRSGKASERKTIIQPGYATGDQFGIAATLILDPKMDVVISSGPKAGVVGHDPTDKAESIRDFYLESGIASWRIHLAKTNDVRNEGMNAMKDKIKTVYKKDFDMDLKKAQIHNHRSEPVGYGTTYIAANWNAAAKNKVRSAWKINDSKDKQIAAWLKSKGVPVAGHNIAILWSRFSGKKGDIHLEHDTSYMGIRQIIMEAAQHYTAIVIAGDPGATAKSAGKYNQIARGFGLNVYNLTGFWNNKSPLLHAWGGDTRIGQLKLYDYLARKFETMKHLGFRSGNLETMAMLGHQVKYMEEPDSKGGVRMQALHALPDSLNTVGGGLAIGYERLLTESPPTRSGKFLKENIEIEGERPAWAPGRPGHAPKPPAIGRYEKGFSGNDMKKIRKYLNIPAKSEVALFAQHNQLVRLDLSNLNLELATIITLLKGLIKDSWLPHLKKLELNHHIKSNLSEYNKLLERRGILVEYK